MTTFEYTPHDWEYDICDCGEPLFWNSYLEEWECYLCDRPDGGFYED